MQIGSLFRSLFSPFFYSDKRQGDQRQASDRRSDDGRFAAHKMAVDMRYRDFSLSISKAKLKGFLKRASNGESPHAAVDTETVEIGQAGQAVDSIATKDLPHQPGISHLLERLNRLYGSVKDIANRIQRLEERILPARNAGPWPGLNPDPAVLVASSLGDEVRELFPREKIEFSIERGKAYQTVHPESFMLDRKLDVVA